MFFIFSFFILIFTKIIIINTFGVNLPYWDQWDAELNSLYLPYIEGKLKFIDLLEQHNEHRIFFSRILCLTVFIINDEWNTLLVMKLQSVIFSFYQIVILYFHKKLFNNSFLSYLMLAFFCIPISTENLLWGFQSHIFFLLLFSSLAFYFESTKITRYLGFLFSIFSFLSLASGFLVSLSIFIVNLFKLLLFKDERRKSNYIYILYYFILLIILKLFMNPHSGHEIYKASSLYNFFDGIYAISSWPNNFFIIGFFLIIFLIFIILVTFQKINCMKSNFIIINITFFIFSIAAMSYSRNNIRYGKMEERYIDFLSIGFYLFIISIGYIIKIYRVNKNYTLISHISIIIVLFLCTIDNFSKTKIKYIELMLIKKNFLSFINYGKYDIENYQTYHLERLYPYQNHFLDILNRSRSKIKINFD